MNAENHRGRLAVLALLPIALMLAGSRACAGTISINEGASISTIIYTAIDTGSGRTYSLVGADASAFNISATGAVRINTVPDFESKASYTFTINTFLDGNLHSAENMVVNVIDLAPVITSAGSVSVNEGVSTGTPVYTAVAADPAGGIVTYSLTGTDASSFNINSATGVVRFNSVPDFEVKSSYNINVRAADSSGMFSTRAVTVSVINLAPVITSSSSVSVDEGVSASTTIYTAAASDPGGGAISYSLMGVDAAFFNINSTTGVMRFNSVPNFETKSSYNINVRAADSSGMFSIMGVTVNVINLAPIITSGASASVPDGASAGTAVYSAVATDPGGGTVTYSLAGADAAAFTIGSADGVVTINAAPDYATRTSYNFNVHAADTSGAMSTKAVTVNVLPPTPAILTIERRSNQVVLSWPVSIPAYALEQVTDLVQTNWASGFVPAVTNNLYLVTIPLTNPATFFRLKRN